MRIAFTVITVTAVFAYFDWTGDDSHLKRFVGQGMGKAQQLIDSAPASLKQLSGGTTVYKHQNDDGNPVFSDQPPDDGREHSSQTWRSDTNVVPSVSQQDSSDQAEISEQESQKRPATTLSPLTPYTNPETVLDLFDDANDIGNKLEERKQRMDRQLENMQ